LPGVFIGHPAKALFAECQTQQHPANQPLPSAGHSAKSGLRQKLSFAECRTLGKARTSTKVVDVTVCTCRHPLSSVAPLGTRQSIFYFFFKFLCRVLPNLAPGKESAA
jgi:hypothetical protein